VQWNRLAAPLAASLLLHAAMAHLAVRLLAPTYGERAQIASKQIFMRFVAPPLPATNNTQTLEPQSDVRETINSPTMQANPPAGYLASHEVDQPAQPVGEWVINTNLWPLGRKSVVTVQVWISAAGRVERWELIGDSRNDSIASESLAHLDETILNAARWRGKLVPSIQRLELLIDREYGNH
jgi:hypothetical protein